MKRSNTTRSRGGSSELSESIVNPIKENEETLRSGWASLFKIYIYMILQLCGTVTTNAFKTVGKTKIFLHSSENIENDFHCQFHAWVKLETPHSWSKFHLAVSHTTTICTAVFALLRLQSNVNTATSSSRLLMFVPWLITAPWWMCWNTTLSMQITYRGTRE